MVHDGADRKYKGAPLPWVYILNYMGVFKLSSELEFIIYLLRLYSTSVEGL